MNQVLAVGLGALSVAGFVGAAVWLAQRVTSTAAHRAAEVVRDAGREVSAVAEARLAQAGEREEGQMERHRHLLAETVAPLSAGLERIDVQVRKLDQQRAAGEGAVSRHLQLLSDGTAALRTQTHALATALRAPQVRGRWGEMQLRRVVEIAGMVEHVDFATQVVADQCADRLRPDLVVRLPQGRQVVVDAKAPLHGLMTSLDSDDDDARRERVRAHVRQVRTHVSQLAGKEYWRQFEPTPEFVVLFLPSESLFSVALEADPALLEDAFAQRVVVATPTTLIALLSTVAYTWRQDEVGTTAAEIVRAGRDMHQRLEKLADHLGTVGKRLNSAVDAYNQTVGSMESRVVPAARRLRGPTDAEANDDLASPAAVGVVARVSATRSTDSTEDQA